MEKRSITCAALSDDDDGISVLETLGSATNFAITGALATGGVATMAAAQPVTLDSVGNDSGITFTVTGTDADGITHSEVITGGNAAAVDTTAFFKTVTQVASSAATAADVKIGPVKANGGVSPTLSVEVNERGDDFQDTLFTDIGAGTYTVEMTVEEKNDTYTNSYSTDANWIAITAFSAKTADVAALLTIPCHGLRMNVATNTSGDFVATLVTRQPR